VLPGGFVKSFILSDLSRGGGGGVFQHDDRGVKSTSGCGHNIRGGRGKSGCGGNRTENNVTLVLHGVVWVHRGSSKVSGRLGRQLNWWFRLALSLPFLTRSVVLIRHDKPNAGKGGAVRMALGVGES